MFTCIDVKFIFDSVQFVQLRKYSPNSRCRFLSCLLAVFGMFLAIISPSSKCSSYSWNEWSARHFRFHNQNTQPRSQVFSVNGAVTSVAGYIFDVVSSLNTKFFQMWSSVTGYGELCVCF